DSENLVESKSLKLYLGSLALTRFGSAEEVASLIAGDLSQAAAGRVEVEVRTTATAPASGFAELPGDCLDGLAVECSAQEVDAALLSAGRGKSISEELHS